MALSGSTSKKYTSKGAFWVWVEWSATQDIASNTTTITAITYGATNGYGWYATSNNGSSVTVNGATTSVGDSGDVSANTSKRELCRRTEVVSHNADGTKSVTISGRWWVNGSISFDLTSSATFTLDNIPRYAAITSFYASNITRNSFKLNYATDKAVSEVQYSTNGGAWTAFPSGGNFSGSANATYSMRIRVKASDSGLWTESSAISVVLVKTASANKPSLSSNTCIQAVLNWSSTQTVTEVQYKIGSGSWVSAGTFTARSSGSFTVPGLTPGQAVTIYVRVKDAVHGTLSGQSEGLSVTPVALSSISTSADFNLESDLPVTISRPSSSLYHDITLEAYYDGAWNAVAINTAQSNKTTSGTLSPTPSAVSTLFSKHPTVKTVSVRIKLVVRWGSSGTVQGTIYRSGTASIVNANPTIAGVTYSDVSTSAQTVIGNDQKILRNRSSLRVVAGTATSQKGATLKTYTVTIGGKNYSVNAGTNLTSESAKQISVGMVDQSSNQTAVLTVTDSRGNTATRTFTVQMLDYQPPQVLQAVPQRLNSYEAPTTMIVEARRYTVKPASVDVNEVYVRYRIKENPSGAFGPWIDLTRFNGSVNGLWQAIAVNQYMADYPNTKSYTVELQISDKFTTWQTVPLELPEGLALLRMLKDRIEAGVDFEIKDNKSLILESPNGTRYKIKVNDSGALVSSIA